MEFRKTAPYVTTYMRTTETGWQVNSEGDGYDPIRPSGCLIKAYWDFGREPVASGQQIYRRKFPAVVDTDNLANFNYPTSVIISRTKVRGRGRVMRLRFESQEGKDFHLLGYSVIGSSNGRF